MMLGGKSSYFGTCSNMTFALISSSRSLSVAAYNSLLVSSSSSNKGLIVVKMRLILQAPATLIKSIDRTLTPLKQNSAKAKTSIVRLSH